MSEADVAVDAGKIGEPDASAAAPDDMTLFVEDVPEELVAGVTKAAAPSPFCLVAAVQPVHRIEKFMQSTTANIRVNTIRWDYGDAGGSKPVVGGVLFCHGYGHYCAVSYDWLASVLWQHGIAAFGIEHIGHGKSEGLPGYIPSFDNVVQDVINWSAIIKKSFLPVGSPLFGYGESLGGGILVHAALKDARVFDGLTLFAPMIGLAAGRAPPYIVQQIGRIAAWIMPTAALAPVADLVPHCFRDADIIPMVREDPYRYSGALRLGTAFELKGAMEAFAPLLPRLSTPFIIFHGTGDAVTAHTASQELFDTCAATDKSLHLFDGAWHVLWCEPLDTRERLLHEWMSWLVERCATPAPVTIPAAAAATATGTDVDVPASATTTAAIPTPQAVAPRVVSTVVTHPLGVAPYREEGHPLTVFNLNTHAHLYTGSHPKHDSEVYKPSLA